MSNSGVNSEPADMTGAVQQLVQFFETLSPQTLGTLHTLYAADARFKDPFNAVQGTAAIERIFAHMFDTLHAPRFVVTQQVVQANQCFLVWDFHFGLRSDKGAVNRHIHGSTHVVFDAAGRVLLHRDYWDAAEELYEKLPVLGSLMRWLRKQLRVPQID